LDAIASQMKDQRSSAAIGVAVVTYNGAPWILRCLASLRESAERVAVVVVDNCSTDNTRDLVSVHYPEVELLRSERNVGFGVGNNIAIANLLQRDCEMVFLLNQDAYILPETLGRLRSFLDEHDEVGVVSPLHCSPDEDQVDMKSFRGYLGIKAPRFSADAVMGRCHSHYRIPGINAAAWLVRSEVFLRVGGFDPLFFMYGEDDDLLERMKEHDVHFALLPSSRVVHLRQSPPSQPPRSWLEKVRRRAKLQRSILLVQVKRPSYSQLFRVRLLISEGLLRPLASWVVKPDGVELISTIYAAIQLLGQIEKIRRHADRLNAPGPHFLIEDSRA